MSDTTKVSSQGRTVVKPVREEKSPDEIIEYLRNHLVEVRCVPVKAVPIDARRRMLDEWARRK